MFAYNLFAVKAQDFFRPGIPTSDMAFGVDHHNGIVCDTIDQQAEVFFRIEAFRSRCVLLLFHVLPHSIFKSIAL